MPNRPIVPPGMGAKPTVTVLPQVRETAWPVRECEGSIGTSASDTASASNSGV